MKNNCPFNEHKEEANRSKNNLLNRREYVGIMAKSGIKYISSEHQNQAFAIQISYPDFLQPRSSNISINFELRI